MVNERYEGHPDNPEESEYHFSDDQVNYELESESYKEGAPVAAAKSGLVEKLKENRRVVIGSLVFVVLLVLVYKMLTPSTPPVPVTDITQQALSPVTKPVVTKVTTVTTEQHSAAPVQPAAAPVQQQVAQPAAPAPMPSVSQAPAVQASTVQASPAPVAAAAPAAPAEQPAVIVQAAAPSPAVDPAAMPAAPAANAEQNTVMMNMMQSQYSQKMAEQEAQVNEMKTQMQELNSRVAGMEVAFRQLTKILRSTRAPADDNSLATASSENSAGAPVIKAGSRFNYTVQAIIPGRAWLKSDSGDTVTVAEGDILKDVGRVMKIDPYDGIVKIDTGKKIITLSYGVAGD